MRRNLILAAVVVTGFFGLIEAGLRLSGRVATQTVRSPDLATRARIPGLFEPGLDFVDRVRHDLPHRVTTNAMGFRGRREYELERTAGRLRVLCVGDSYTWGHYVDNEQTFPAALERLFVDQGIDAEVINAGANGFTIVDERLYLEEKGMALRPDIVIVGFTQNDIQDLKRERPWIEGMREHARLKSVRIVGPTLKFLQRTAIFNGMQQLAAWWRVRGSRAPDDAVAAGAVSALWTTYRGQLNAVAHLVQESGARLLLVGWPSADQVEESASMIPMERMAAIASAEHVEWLDLSGTMMALEREGVNPTLRPKDGHPSPEGHAAAARATGERLSQLGWLVGEAATR